MGAGVAAAVRRDGVGDGTWACRQAALWWSKPTPPARASVIVAADVAAAVRRDGVGDAGVRPERVPRREVAGATTFNAGTSQTQLDGNHPDSMATSCPKALNCDKLGLDNVFPPHVPCLIPEVSSGRLMRALQLASRSWRKKKTKRAGASFSGNLAEACISCRASSTMKASWGIHHVVNDVDVVGIDSSLVVQEIIQ